MKVLIVTGSYPPNKCGVGDYASKLAQSLVEYTNLDICILTTSGNVESANYSNNIIKLYSIIEAWKFSEIFHLIKFLRDLSPDIIHIQYPTQGYKDGLLPPILPIIAYLMRIKVVQTWHEIYTNSYDLRLLIKAIIPGGLVVVRPEYKNKFAQKLQWIFKNKIFKFIRNASAIPSIELSESETALLKNYYKKQQRRLIVFFGFIYEHKGTELLFEIANPETDQIVIAGQFDKYDVYHQKILDLANGNKWANKVSITGFLDPIEISKLLKIADAVVLPFKSGGGEWNTTIHSAVLQKVFVLTTSESASGYDALTNVYYAKIGDTAEMRSALKKYSGKLRTHNPNIDKNEWQLIAKQHQNLYSEIIKK